jgi:uncharacterized membrane protein
MDIIIADPLCEPGHIPTTSYFLKDTKKVHNVYFIANKMYAKSIGHKSVTTTIPNPKPYGGLGFILINLLILWKISTLSKKSLPNAPIVLLSYETISFMICRFLFSNLKNSYVFNHNNIDQLDTSYMRRLAFSTLCIPTKHLVYEPFIKDHLSLNPKFNVLYVSHPLIFNWMPQPTDKKINVFVPHMLDYTQFNELNQFSNDGKHFNIRAKFDESISTNNITTMPFFSNFEEELGLSNIVIVFTTYKFRSSGVAYAAISSGRILIIRNSLFSTNLALKFPEQVFLFTDMTSLFILLNEFKRDRNYFNFKLMDKEVSRLEGVISN